MAPKMPNRAPTAFQVGKERPEHRGICSGLRSLKDFSFPTSFQADFSSEGL